MKYIVTETLVRSMVIHAPDEARAREWAEQGKDDWWSTDSCTTEVEKQEENGATSARLELWTPPASLDVRMTLNKLISERTRYGAYDVVTSTGGSILAWSNASRRWYRSQSWLDRRVRLDANEIFAPFEAGIIDAVLAEEPLDELPLYRNSFEARFTK